MALADRLWDRATPGPGSSLTLVVAVEPSRIDTEPFGPPEEHWRVYAERADLSWDGHLHASIDCASGRLEARVTDGLLARDPSLVARLLLETPAAVLLARRGYAVLHAGAVAGPAGAVVVRGAPGTGKSTLVAATYRAGFRVLGDESILVSRRDPDALIAAVRDVTILPDATRLLGLEHSVTPAGTVAEPKHRLDLFLSSTPAVRRARRVATVLLGDRDGGAAHLEPLSPGAFLEEFRRGAIEQERWSGTPPEIASRWARAGAYRLSGAADLAGAVDLLADLVSQTSAAVRA